MIFLIKKIRCEISFILSNIYVIVIFSFLTSLGGVLLWVNGGSVWFIMQSSKNPNNISLSAVFVLSLVIYAMMGAVVSIVLKTENHICRGKNALTAIVLTMAMYILSLSWYAVFFCTRMSLFSAILLMIVVILGVLLFFTVKKRLIILGILVLLIEFAEIYLLYVNISFCLLN